MKQPTSVTSTRTSLVPPDPIEVEAAAVDWQRTGLLQRLVRSDRQADALAAHRAPIHETAARRAA
jgi:hypothetical protein